MDQPELNADQQATEATNLRDKIGGREADDSIHAKKEAIEGKVKKIIDDITKLQSKVSSLGTSIEAKFDNYISKKLEESMARFVDNPDAEVDIDNASSTQEKVKLWASESVTENINETLREFDRGLDKVILRVNFRKEMAKNLEGMDKILPEDKNRIGSALENQLARLEGDIEGNSEMTVDQLKANMSILHEITKYGNMRNACTNKGANSLQNRKLIPEHSIAYPPTAQNNFTYFEYWIEGDVLHCIDTNGAIQQMNPFKEEAFDSNPWEVVYNPLKSPKVRSPKLSDMYTDEVISKNTPKSSALNKEQRTQMILNGMKERTIIKASDRNFNGMPAAERSRLEGMLRNKLNQLKASQKEAYLKNPGSDSSFQPVVDTFAYAGSDQFTTVVNDVSSTFSTVKRGINYSPAKAVKKAVKNKTTSKTETAKKTPFSKELKATMSPKKIALSGKQINKDIVVADLKESGKNVERQVVDSTGKEIPYLEIKNNKIVVKKGVDLNIPEGAIVIRMQAREKNAQKPNEWVQSREYTFKNENPQNALKGIKARSEELKRGTLLGDDKIAITSYQKDLPQGFTVESIKENVTSSHKVGPVAISSKDFKVKDNQLFYVGIGIAQNTTISMSLMVKDAQGDKHQIDYQFITVAPEALKDNDISLENSEKVGGVSVVTVEKGAYKKSDKPQSIEGVKIQKPSHAEIDITRIQELRSTAPLTDNGKPIVELNYSGELILKAGHSLKVGKYTLNITSNTYGVENTNHKVIFEIKDKPKNYAKKYQFDAPNSDVERKNTDMGEKLYSAWTDEEEYGKIKRLLSGFSSSEEKVSTFTIGTIDKNQGRYFVHNNGFTTKINVNGDKYEVETGGPNGLIKTSFDNSESGIRETIATAVSINKLLDLTLNELKLDSLSKYDKDGKKGEFVSNDMYIDVNDNTGALDITDTTIWSPPSEIKDSQRDNITKLLNGALKDILGTSKEASTRTLDERFEAGRSLQVKSPDKIISGKNAEISLKNLDGDYIYSFSANRINWYQVKETDGALKITIPKEDMDSVGNAEKIVKGMQTYVRLTVSALPKDKNNQLRPKLIQIDIPFEEPYLSNRLGANKFKITENNSTASAVEYELATNTSLDDKKEGSEDFAIYKDSHMDGSLLIYDKNDDGNFIAKIVINEKGQPSAEFYPNYKDVYKSTLNVDLLKISRK